MMSPEGILLLLVLIVLLLLLVLTLGLRSAVARLERRQLHQPDGKEPIARNTETEAKESAFQAFLAEDPRRLALSKSDQSAAFREWRRQKGMNWSNS